MYMYMYTFSEIDCLANVCLCCVFILPDAAQPAVVFSQLSRFTVNGV